MIRTLFQLWIASSLLCTLPAGAGAQEDQRPAPRVALGSVPMDRAESPADTAPTPPAGSAPRLEAGFGRITFHGLLQAWYAGESGAAASTFRIRRAELKFVGDLTPRARWTVVVDPAKALALDSDGTAGGGGVNQATRLLQDALVTLELGRGVRLYAGQFKVPLSYEGLASSAGLETVERALFLADHARSGTYGDIRDVGASLQVSVGRHVAAQAGIFNGLGEGFNTVDANEQKTVAGRMTVRLPFLEGVQVGGSAAYDPGTEGAQLRRSRIGGELAYVRGPLSLHGEAMAGRDGGTRRLGYYISTGRHITPRFQVVARYDVWDPDTRREDDADNATEREYVAGINYRLSGDNVKVQANYVRSTFGAGLPSRDLLLLNLQTAW